MTDPESPSRPESPSAATSSAAAPSAAAPSAAAPSAGLEPTLAAYLDEARRCWPELAVDLDGFAAHVRERAGAEGVPPLGHAGDLLLAYACARGIPAAIEQFHQIYDPSIRRVLARRNADDALADDARQGVYERLLVGRAEQAPKISEYRGAGRLESWVATAASTTLLMLQRAAGRRREQAETSATAELAGPLDPELEFIRTRYKTQLEDAIAAALAELGDRERTLLRLHLGERLSIDVLASMYAVNRATAARWLVAARQQLLSRARAAIRSSLGSSDEELESLGVLLQSQLHVSLTRRLT